MTNTDKTDQVTNSMSEEEYEAMGEAPAIKAVRTHWQDGPNGPELIERVVSQDTGYAGLVERLVDGTVYLDNGHFWIADTDKTDALLDEAAAAIRDLEARLAAIQPDREAVAQLIFDSVEPVLAEQCEPSVNDYLAAVDALLSAIRPSETKGPDQ